ncbi:hypothetical protein RND81_12G111000 [Saponaria officinalis]|uniref:Uncharacterized protein n=1 Tax=Saponaria officinalis TaxID=3572 RepID=A0AAW1H964_SAPOF
MGKCNVCEKLGTMLPRNELVGSYQFALLLSPLISVWDCTVRTIRYNYGPEWV